MAEFRDDDMSDEVGESLNPAAMAAQLADMASELAELAHSDELRRRVLGRVARIFGADVGLLAPWDRRAGELGTPARIGDDELWGAVSPRRIMEAVAGPGAAGIGTAGRAAIISSPAETVGLQNLGSLLFIPLIAMGELDGILLLGRRQGGRAFTDVELHMSRLAGNFSAAVIGHATDFERFSRDLRVQIVEATQELSALKAELDRVKGFNEDIFDSIGMGIVVFDRNFDVVFRNRRARRCFPDVRGVKDGLGRMIVPEMYGKPGELLDEMIRLGQAVSMEGVRYRPSTDGGNSGGSGDGDGGGDSGDGGGDGGDSREEFILHLGATPLLAGGSGGSGSGGSGGSGSGTVVGGIISLDDVTSDISMQRRLASSERLAAVGRLAAKVAHELNNPLDGILRYINLASRVAGEGGDERPVAYLDEARTGLMRMARIIGELLEFSRSTVRSNEAVDLRRALKDASMTLAGPAERNGVRIEVKVDDDVPALESGSLYQVLTNLMKNGIEAMPDGGLLTVRASRAARAAGAVEISVGDRGPGIPSDRLETVFEPFYSTKQAGQGTGLGLAICRELVEKHGGSLTARNRAGGGAEFVIRIPTSS